jgi:hypothetical protein
VTETTRHVSSYLRSGLDLRDALAAEKFGKPPKALIVILGHSGAAYRRKDGVLVYPISLLKA